MEPPISMPGSFLTDHESTLRPHLSRPTATSSFFIPPSPSASRVPSYSAQPTSRSTPRPGHSSRKRPRVDTSDDAITTLVSHQTNDASTSSFSLEAPSPAPLVSDTYRLVGGSDTPIALQLRQEAQTQDEFEQDCRPSRYVRQSQIPPDSNFPQTPASFDGDSGKRPLSSSSNANFSRSVIAFTGNVVRKVFNFCWNTAFNGFHSGQGRGYNVDIGTPNVASSTWTEVQEKEDVFHDEYHRRGVTPLPGGFPEDDPIEHYMSKRQPYGESATPTQNTDSGCGSALRSNWVIVNDPQQDMSKASPARRRPRPSTASLYARPLSRGSLGSRPRLQGHRHSGSNASFASPRASGLPVVPNSRPQSSDGPGRQAKRSRPSIASPRASHTNETCHTAKSPEVTKFEKKLRRNDQKQDESIRRLNQQMQDMIQEARQALGAKVEIEDDVDEGYEEDLAAP